MGILPTSFTTVTLRSVPRLNLHSLLLGAVILSSLQLLIVFLSTSSSLKHCQTIGESLFFHTLESNPTQTSVLNKSSLERHRPALRFALILPFALHQAPLLHRNLETLWPLHPPCDPSRHYSPLIDLVFYTNRISALTPSTLKRLRDTITHTRTLSRCFSSVKFITANLSPQEDTYPLGAAHMFFKLLAQFPTPPAPLAPYNAMFYMEPDVIPCRRHWLDRLYEESSIPGDFWVRGSILRNANPQTSTWTFANHINGNALYRLDDARFHRFLSLASKEFFARPRDFAGGYDVGLYLVRENRSLVGWDEYAGTAHLWQFTGTVQNWYRTGVNASRVCKEKGGEETYLVHGREVVW
ncbi:hypothetical protein HDU96_010269 [Phlyctochytrium bullatum]|nr:hypothetical protein HDU96_010269 [Phlyctochytrium bullatum]